MISTRSRTRTWRAVAAVAVAALAGVAGCGGGSGNSSSGTATDEVVLGAAWPLSGPFAYNGQAVLDGAEAAAKEINANGGIAALGGAKLTIRSVDAGSSAQTASAAAERLTTDDKVVAVMGSWLSSLSLAASEVTERAGTPYVSESFADQMTSRDGFTHVFDYAPPSSKIAGLLLDSVEPSLQAGGIPFKRVALIGDNTAAATPLINALAEELKKRSIEVPVQEQWTPPLQDAAGIVQKVSSAKVDAILMIAFSFNDVSSVVRQIRAQSVHVPIIQNGGQAIVPQWRDMGDDTIGLSTFVYANPLKKSKKLTDALAKATNVPYVWQDQIGGYFAVNLLAAALEKAGSSDREDLTKALHELKLTSGTPVELMPTSEIAFAPGGRIDPPFGVLVQWQKVNGELVPCTVYPADQALCEPAWK